MNSLIIEKYESYINTFEILVYDNLAIKLATYKGFLESLDKNKISAIECFPLLPIIVEALQVDCVMTVSKLTEGDRCKNTIQNFLNFVLINLNTIKEKYDGISEASIEKEKQIINDVSEKIKIILRQRDKYYAHSDNQYFSDPSKIISDFPETYEYLGEITNALQNIISHHIYITRNTFRTCRSDLAFMSTFTIMEFMKESASKWLQRYRPEESFE